MDAIDMLADAAARLYVIAKPYWWVLAIAGVGFLVQLTFKR